MIKFDLEYDESITIYTNSNIVPVYYAGLTDEQYITLVHQILKTVNSFASNGSGWIINKIDRIVLNVVRISPITASPYMKLPPNFDRKVSQYLMNLRNTNDNNCFGYCITAAYHL